jgi:hypothetical protein
MLVHGRAEPTFLLNLKAGWNGFWVLRRPIEGIDAFSAACKTHIARAEVVNPGGANGTLGSQKISNEIDVLVWCRST